MKHFGQIVFAGGSIGSGSGHAYDYRYGDYYIKRYANGLNIDITCWNRPFTMGEVFANEFDVDMNMSFKLEDGDGTEYVIFTDGIYENVKGKWVNVTQIVNTLPIFKRFLNRTDNRIVKGNVIRRDGKGFFVGDLVKGVNTVYGITDVDMTLGRIKHIERDGNSIVIEILEHNTMPNMVGTLQNAALFRSEKAMFERVDK